MSHRVIDDEVKLIFPDTTKNASPFIEVANLVVDETLASLGMSAERLKQIELYLAAHFMAITEERGAPRRQRLGETVEEWFQDIGKGLNATRFGQQALLLDTTGTLSSENAGVGKPNAQFRVV